MQATIELVRDKKIFEFAIEDMLLDWIRYIGASEETAQRALGQIKNIFLGSDGVDELEDRLHKLVWSVNDGETCANCLRDEEELVFSEVRPHLVPGSYLDVGAGSGLIANRIKKDGFETTIVDVIDFNKSELDLILYDGKKIPFDEDPFDNVTLLTVLHHCDDPKQVLREAIRVCKDTLVVIESVYTNEREYHGNVFFDWLWNRVVYKGINVPFHFERPERWERFFEEYGMRIHRSIDLGYDSPMTPEHHWLYVLKK